MNAAVAEPQTTPDTAQEPTAEAERSRQNLFEYSRWLHVGEGALECEHNVKEDDVVRATGKCKDPDHFHAWIRLPNQFQVRDIIEKASAARARRKKLLRDPSSDAAAILDGELDDLRDEALKPVLVEEILEESYYEIFQQAQRAVRDIEDENGDEDEDGNLPKLYAHIDQDREEYQRLAALPEEQRPTEEFATLEQHTADYSRAVTDEIERLQAPRRETLMEKSMDEILKLVRDRRITQISTEVYLHTFNSWQWYVCTFKPTANGIPRERFWPDIAVMKFETDEKVINALADGFAALEGKMARGKGLGNS
jgi:hypothetical protein